MNCDYFLPNSSPNFRFHRLGRRRGKKKKERKKREREVENIELQVQPSNQSIHQMMTPGKLCTTYNIFIVLSLYTIKT
jgi:hypothetical protein